MDVGIRELKQRLSEYLELVAKGEIIRVTDRGKPKAILSPVLDEDAVARGIEAGWLTPGESAPPRNVRRAKARTHSIELLREDRDGR